MGDNILRDVERLNAFLKDCVQENSEEEKIERNIVVNAISNNIVELLKEVKNKHGNDLTKFVSEGKKIVNKNVKLKDGDVLYAVYVFAVLLELIEINPENIYISPRAQKVLESIKPKKYMAEELRGLCSVEPYHLYGYTKVDKKIWTNNTNLLQIHLSDKIEKIEDRAFEGCSNLQNIKISKSVCEIGEGVFKGCESLKEIQLHDMIRYTMEDNVLIDLNSKKIIRNIDKDKAKYIVNNTISSIGAYAFEGTKLEEVMIAESVETIAEEAFLGNNALMKYYVHEDNNYFTTHEGALYSRDKSRLISYPCGKMSPNYILPKTIKTIQRAAFMNSQYLNSILLPSNISGIGECAFKGCKRLEWVILCEIESIPKSMFEGCAALRSIILPKRLNKIESRAFADCTELKTIYISAGVKEISDDSFINTPKLEFVIENNEYVEMYCKERGLKYSIGNVLKDYQLN